MEKYLFISGLYHVKNAMSDGTIASQFLSTCALLSVVMSTYQSMFPYGRTEVYLLALAHAIAVALDIAAFVVLVFDLAKAVKGRKAKRMVRYALVRKL